MLWRYAFPSERGKGGWCVFVLGSDGYFSAVSDYGNYAYWWTAHGMRDFREFLLGAEKDADYFAGKLAPEKVYDAEGQYREVLRRICQARREGLFTKAEAREEWEFVKECNLLIFSCDAERWAKETRLEPFRVTCRSRRALGFVERCIVGRLLPVLREDLKRSLAFSADDALPGMI